MLNFIKWLFGIKEKCCCEYDCTCCKNNLNEEEDFNEIIERNNYTIILPYSIKNELDKKGYLISAKMYKGKPSCIQMFKRVDGKSVYAGTLKNYMNVKSFKDNNICNFSEENLIYKE